MTDQEKELDITIATAEAVIKQAEKLAAIVVEKNKEFNEWQKTHGLDNAVMEKFFNALTPEDEKKLAAERELFENEVQHDLEAAVKNSGLTAAAQPRKAIGRRSRDMI